MPEDLKGAHAVLDDMVDSCYPGYPFANDEARLECLFKLYEKMIKINKYGKKWNLYERKGITGISYSKLRT